jgi:hypothetical protein
MAVHVEIRLVAMHPFADVVRHPAHSQNIARAVESKSVIGVQSFPRSNLTVNRLKAGVVSLE